MKQSTLKLIGVALLIGQNLFAAEAPLETNEQVIRKAATAGQPNGRWKEGLTFEGVAPMPWMKNTVNWYPGETIPTNELRITFMGSAPLVRPGQMGTSVFVELGNGDSFIFDIGPGAIQNYLAAGIPLNKVNNILITHLHYDHFASLPTLYAYGGAAGRWHESLRITGPSGREPKLGTKYMMEKMQSMMTWQRDAMNLTPVGDGWKVEVNEFDFRDDGGVAYEKNGVKITHWRQSHIMDGASAYRLDWNGLSVSFTGDGRPNSLTLKYAKGVDVLITEIQVEVVALNAQVSGALPFIARNTIDMAHSPAYACGYLYDQAKPRMAMATHVQYDAFAIAEMVAEVREFWKGPFRFGAPDMIVVNLSKDKVWVREGVIAKYPNVPAPQYDYAADGSLVLPAPLKKRSDVQSRAVRDLEISPDLYYPAGYKPELLTDWPTDKALRLSPEAIPAALRK